MLCLLLYQIISIITNDKNLANLTFFRNSSDYDASTNFTQIKVFNRNGNEF